MIKRIVEGGAFSKGIDLSNTDQVCLGASRTVKIHSALVPEPLRATRWAVIQIGENFGYVFGGETLHSDLEADGFEKCCEIYISKRRIL